MKQNESIVAGSLDNESKYRGAATIALVFHGFITLFTVSLLVASPIILLFAGDGPNVSQNVQNVFTLLAGALLLGPISFTVSLYFRLRHKSKISLAISMSIALLVLAWIAIPKLLGA